MDVEEALKFLAQHQPMPSDANLTQELMDRYDEVRRYFLTHEDARCVPLFLGSFGDGSGWGVYQLVENVLRRYPSSVVVPALGEALNSSYRGVRNWSLEIAMSFPDRSLVPHFARMLFSKDYEERLLAADNVRQVYRPEDREVVLLALATESDPEIQEILKSLIAQ
jgi:hypothetical protein